MKSPPYTFRDGELPAQLLADLGRISADRVVRFPAPGTASILDLEHLRDPEDRTCELVNGTIVRKANGVSDALVVTDLICAVYAARRAESQYVVTESRGLMLLRDGVVRSPNVALTRLSRLPDIHASHDAIPRLAPNLAIDVVMPGNTATELELKRCDFFQAGTEQFWIVSAKHRTVTIYMPHDPAGIVFHDDDIIDGGLTFPNLRFPVAELFAQYNRFAPAVTP